MQKATMMFHNVTWNSYVEFTNAMKKEHKMYNVRYNGNELYGDVEVHMPRYGDDEENNYVLAMAAEILRF